MKATPSRMQCLHSEQREVRLEGHSQSIVKAHDETEHILFCLTACSYNSQLTTIVNAGQVYTVFGAAVVVAVHCWWTLPLCLAKLLYQIIHKTNFLVQYNTNTISLTAFQFHVVSEPLDNFV